MWVEIAAEINHYFGFEILEVNMATYAFVKAVVDDRLKMYCITTKAALHRKDLYKQCVYGKWALLEIRQYLLEHAQDPLELAIEQYRKLMDEYCLQAKNEDTSIMFSVAYDVATEMLDICIHGGY